MEEKKKIWVFNGDWSFVVVVNFNVVLYLYGIHII